MKRRCKLCHEDKLLVRSHIIPELFFRYMYDENSRALLIDPDRLKPVNIQQGPKEYLLCSVCEKRLSVYETYIGNVWNKTIPEEIKKKYTIISGLDYAKFKLFHLSVLWRASVSSLEFYNQVSLGQKHEEILRQMILNDDPGKPEQYPFITSILTLKGQIIHTVIPPLKAKENHTTFYLFFFGGMTWEYLISGMSPSILFPTYPFFNQSGKLYTFTENIFGNPQYKVLEEKVLKAWSLEKVRSAFTKK